MSIQAQAEARINRISERVTQREQAQRRFREEHLGEVVPQGGAALAQAQEEASRLLVAEGDSWFDYPGTDVLEELEDLFEYEVESVASGGDTLESMTYAPRQLDRFDRMLRKIAKRGKVPRAVLLSAGGNDIAGDELAMLINHAASGEPPLHDGIVDGFLDRLRRAYLTLIVTIDGLCQQHFQGGTIPVVIHGYDFPVPDGRGYFGGWGPLPGPWLQPSLKRRGHTDLAKNTEIMQDLIHRFNSMLQTLSDELAQVTYLNLRGTLSNDLAGNAYRELWDNELHPEDEGFRLVAEKFDQVLRQM